MTAVESHEERTVPDHPRWYGALAGVLAALVALIFGELVEAISDSIPGLVLGMGEWILDITPGRAAREGIENLGSNAKGSLLPGITIVALLLAALLGDLARRRSIWFSVAGFAVFGLLGGFTTARNPQSPAFASWFWAIVAAGLGVATLVLLLTRMHRPTRLAGVLEDPRDPRATRRAFLSWSAGAGAVAVTGLAVADRVEGRSAAEIARGELDVSDFGATTSVPGASPVAVPDPITPGSFDEIDGIGRFITPNDTFYRIDTALSVPQVDPDSWSLSFTGMVDNPYTLTFEEILAMDLEEQVVTLSCVSNEVGGGLVGTATWLGVPITTLLERAGVQDGAEQFVGRSVDDWTAGFPLDVLDDGRNAMLAVAMNGEPLPIIHGFPARLVVAGLYGYVSAVKWIEEINLNTWDGFNGYWVPRGWSKLGPIKTMSRIDVPRHRTDIPAGPTAVAGVAWSPPRGIQRVELEFNVDDGWHECEIAAPGTDETWVQWKYEWDAPPGEHVLRVRAIDGDGELQPLGPKSVAPDGAEGWHVHQVRAT
ncbi:MAG: molybdopterin-dependent oxidoreductase [Acidimicrobiales bacterium]|jgi:DMSO/TMAO reductase YedYZ molybdopterin-dependent catalytic subunit|nr:molybdopterin-dependent oxidoreductase [Acidimicrobiales bacterium]